MAAKKDFVQRALSIVEEVTGDGPLIDTPEKCVAKSAKVDDGKNPAAVSLGRLGGLKGGRERAKNMSATERSEAGKKAAAARWSKKS